MGWHEARAQARGPPDHPGLHAEAAGIRHRGPKQAENLNTRLTLEDDFGGYRDLNIVEEERELYKGTSHSGIPP